MKRCVVSLMACMMCVAMVSGMAFAVAEPDTVVAKVNGEEISQRDVNMVVEKFVLPQFKAQNPDKEFPEAEREKVEPMILDQLVTRTLLMQVAEEKDVTPDEAMVDQQFEALKAQQPDIADDELRQFIAEELAIQETIQQEVVANIEVTDEEAKEYYEQHKEQFNEPAQIRASHILIQVDPEATEDDKEAARQKIEEVLTMAEEGQDFAELAKTHSEGPSNVKGGDLGFFARNSMVKPFEDAAFKLATDEISDVVETRFGYHIIKVTDKKDPRTVSFEEVKDQLKNSLLKQKTNNEVSQWINQLKTEATIEMMNQEQEQE